MDVEDVGVGVPLVDRWMSLRRSIGEVLALREGAPVRRICVVRGRWGRLGIERSAWGHRIADQALEVERDEQTERSEAEHRPPSDAKGLLDAAHRRTGLSGRPVGIIHLLHSMARESLLLGRILA